MCARASIRQVCRAVATGCRATYRGTSRSGDFSDNAASAAALDVACVVVVADASVYVVGFDAVVVAVVGAVVVRVRVDVVSAYA